MRREARRARQFASQIRVAAAMRPDALRPRALAAAAASTRIRQCHNQRRVDAFWPLCDCRLWSTINVTKIYLAPPFLIFSTPLFSLFSIVIVTNISHNTCHVQFEIKGITN